MAEEVLVAGLLLGEELAPLWRVEGIRQPSAVQNRLDILLLLTSVFIRLHLRLLQLWQDLCELAFRGQVGLFRRSLDLVVLQSSRSHDLLLSLSVVLEPNSELLLQLPEQYLNALKLPGKALGLIAEVNHIRLVVRSKLLVQHLELSLLIAGRRHLVVKSIGELPDDRLDGVLQLRYRLLVALDAFNLLPVIDDQFLTIKHHFADL